MLYIKKITQNPIIQLTLFTFLLIVLVAVISA